MSALLLVKKRDQLGQQAPPVLTAPPSVHYCSHPSGTPLYHYRRASFLQEGQIEE